MIDFCISGILSMVFVTDYPTVTRNTMRLQWRDLVLRYLVRRKMITSTEASILRRRYPAGFHVYGQPIDVKGLSPAAG